MSQVTILFIALLVECATAYLAFYAGRYFQFHIEEKNQQNRANTAA